LSWAGDLDIDDYTAHLSATYPISEATLTTALTDNGILIVTSSGVYLGKFSKKWNVQERIVQASIVGSEIALVIYDEIGQWRLLALHILQNGSEISLLEGMSVPLPREPTVAKLFPGSASPTFATLSRGYDSRENFSQNCCFVALRSPPAILVYALDENLSPNLVYELNCKPPKEQDSPTSEIHSLEILLERGGPAYLLVGLRHGLLKTFRVDFSQQWNFFNEKITRLGESPVEFISATHEVKDHTNVFAMCDYLWEIRLEKVNLQIDEVLFDDFRMVKQSIGKCL
jgi:hypothetical protein